MGYDAWRPLWPRGMAIRSGSGGTDGRADDGRRIMDDRGQTTENPYLSSVLRRPCSDLSSVQILRRIDRGRAFTDFKMQLRRGDIPGLTGVPDHLAALHRLAAFDQNVAGMRIGGDEAIGVADEDQIAIALQLTAGIGNHAVLCGLDRGALRHGEIDPVILDAIRLRSERRDHAAAYRPAESRQATGRLRVFDGVLTGHCRGGFNDAHGL